MEKLNNILFFSCNTKLAYFIGERFYSSKHFVWCSPVFNPLKLSQYDVLYRVPSSSSPHEIYRRFKSDVASQDGGSKMIEANKNGLHRGALHMRRTGQIDDQDLARISAIIEAAGIPEFSPLVYVIPKSLIKDKVRQVEVEEVANPLGAEFQIPDLHQDEFEIIEFE